MVSGEVVGRIDLGQARQLRAVYSTGTGAVPRFCDPALVFGLRRLGGWLRGGRCSRHRHRHAHFFAVPLLAAPAVALGVDDAGAGAAAAFVVLHS